MLTADGNLGAEIWDLDTGKSIGIPVPGRHITCWAVYSEKTGNYYVSDPGTFSITEIHIDNKLNATLINNYPFIPGSFPVDMTVVTAGNKESVSKNILPTPWLISDFSLFSYIYVISGGVNSIQTLELIAPGNAQVGPLLNLTVAAPHVKSGKRSFHADINEHQSN